MTAPTLRVFRSGGEAFADLTDLTELLRQAGWLIHPTTGDLSCRITAEAYDPAYTIEADYLSGEGDMWCRRIRLHWQLGAHVETFVWPLDAPLSMALNVDEPLSLCQLTQTCGVDLREVA